MSRTVTAATAKNGCPVTVTLGINQEAGREDRGGENRGWGVLEQESLTEEEELLQLDLEMQELQKSLERAALCLA